MAKLKVVFQSILVVCLVLGINSNLQNAKAATANLSVGFQLNPANSNLDWKVGQEIPDTYQLVGENETFQLYADPASLAFKVVDKRSGYIWNSNLDEKIKGDRLNKTWTAFASSGISIDYLDKKATSERASVTNTDHTTDFKKIDQGFEASIKFTDAGITLKLIVKLEPNGASVELPFDGIKEENPDFKLGTLYLYPFMGYTRTNITPGYMLIPDGAGSLIRFAETTKATNMFYGRYYGSDLGMITTLPYDPTINRPYRLSLPVYGMVHGEKENAYISILEKGASYGELQVHPAGIITNFNFMFNAFVYNESYFQATNRSGAGVTTLQASTNAFDIKMHYRFLTKQDADYVGMARSYQQYLVDKGDLKKVSSSNGDIGVKLEFLGGEKEKILFWNQSIPMTTTKQMDEILAGLGVKNPEVVYYGWQPLGASTMPPHSLKLEKSLGTIGELSSMVEKVTAEGGNFYLYLDPQAAFRDESGYSPRYDLAMSITDANLMAYNRDKVNFFLNLPAVDRSYSNLSKEVFSNLKAGLALDGIGAMLFSDFKKDNLLNRESTIEKYQALLLAEKGQKAFYLPNDYVFSAMDAYFDIPLSDSGYIYTSDVVPFIQIVLAGYVPYYGTALNFSSNNVDDLLRHADFGIYPSYYLTYEPTAKILNTRSSWIYTSSYTQWAPEVNRAYQWLNQLLGPVKGQTIISREYLADGVVAVTYSNQKQIIVNYTDQPYTSGAIRVNSKDAILREVKP